MNVVQSKNSAWMYITEAVFYGSSPWPTNFVALTVANWKKVTLNSSDCSELVIRDPYLKTRYLPPWKKEVDVIKSDKWRKFITLKLIRMSDGLRLVTDLFDKKRNRTNYIYDFDMVMSKSLKAGQSMLTFMTNQTMHFVDMKPAFLSSFANPGVDADNIIGMTLLIFNGTHELRKKNPGYVNELERIMKEFQVEVKTTLNDLKEAKNITINRTIVTQNELFNNDVRQWFTKHNKSINELNKDDWPTDFIIPNKLEIDINQAIIATEFEVTRQVLLKQLCTVPPWNNIWGFTEAGEGYDRDKFDHYTCWKGMGMGSCDNELGYWHYPGVPGCNWWVNRLPRERFDDIFGNDETLRKIVKHAGLLFS